jgi:long-chain acyl-CoA synthetase
MMPNVLQYPVALYGVLRAGMVVVNTNPLYTPRELEHQLKDSGAKAIVIVENFAHVLQQVLPRTDLKKVLVTRIGDLLGLPRGMIVNFVLRHVRKQIPAWSMPGSITFKSALSAGLGLKLERAHLGPQDIAFLQYTGGTTGVAKAAVLTHRNMVANVLQANAWIKPALTATNVQRIVITALPLYHIFSLTANCLLVPALGRAQHLDHQPAGFSGFRQRAEEVQILLHQRRQYAVQRPAAHAGFRVGGFQRAAHVLGRRHGRAGGGCGALEEGHGQCPHAGMGIDRNLPGGLHQSHGLGFQRLDRLAHFLDRYFDPRRQRQASGERTRSGKSACSDRR